MAFADPLRSFDGIVRKLSLAGPATGPLAGTTFVAKDLYDVQGSPTGAGNPDWERTHNGRRGRRMSNGSAPSTRTLPRISKQASNPPPGSPMPTAAGPS